MYSFKIFFKTFKALHFILKSNFSIENFQLKLASFHKHAGTAGLAINLSILHHIGIFCSITETSSFNQPWHANGIFIHLSVAK